MSTYEDLKNELIEIAKVLGKFPEDVKPKVFDLLVDQYLGKGKPFKERLEKTDKEKDDDKKNKSPKIINEKNDSKGRVSKRKSGESYTVDRNLNLWGDDKIQSFKDFCATKAPSSAMEMNSVSIYYLKKVLKLKNVTLDHVYTCYFEVSKKPPKAFRQSFTDTKNKLGTIEFGSDGYLEIFHRGVVFVEHELPKEKTKAKK